MSSLHDWIIYGTGMNNEYYPYGDVYNIPYHLGNNVSELILGFIAWIIDLIVPGNGVSTWLVSDAVVNVITYVVLIIVIFAVGFIVNLTMIWEERKVLGRLMDRRATKIGPLGYFQCLGDGLKTFMKENIAPKAIDKKIYWWSLVLVIGTSVLIACMIPLSPHWFIVDYNMGLLLIFGLFALAPFMILCSGWSQNNKYSLIGGMRAAELMISYEVPMLIMLATVCFMAGSYNIGDIVAAQNNTIWYVVPNIIGFIAFFVCAIAESERVPFDLSEAEAELVEGWQTEYAGMKWGLIMLGDYFRGYVACAFIVILFLGGWALPFNGDISTFTIGGMTLGWNFHFNGFDYPFAEVVFIIKVCLVFFVFAWARGAFPRVRTDQILNIGWKVLMPLAIINLAITVVLKLTLFENLGW